MSTVQSAAVMVIPGGATGLIVVGVVIGVAILIKLIMSAQDNSIHRHNKAVIAARPAQPTPVWDPARNAWVIPPQPPNTVWDQATNSWVIPAETPEQFKRRTGQS